MNLKSGFTWIVLVVFIVGWMIFGLATFTLERHNARQENIYTARLLMSAATASRDYTSDLISPLFADQPQQQGFIRETVPSYAAQQVFKRMGEQHKQYSYAEVALNPTNPDDLAADWQVDLIKYFRENPDVQQIVDTRVDRENVKKLFVAAPIRITSPQCLVCHSTPDVAPASLIKTYGTSNGFGWELNQVIGAQVISVPTAVAEERAKMATSSYLILTASIFLIAYSALQIIVHRWVESPLNTFAKILEEMSTQQAIADTELPEGKIDSMLRLNKAINRLIISLNKSLLKST